MLSDFEKLYTSTSLVKSRIVYGWGVSLQEVKNNINAKIKAGNERVPQLFPALWILLKRFIVIAFTG
jgi:hypothetical protein